MSNLLWETLDHYPFHYFIHWWCDFAPCFYLSWSSLFSCLLCSHYNPFITFDLSHFFWPSCPSLAMIYFRFDIRIILTHLIISSFLFIDFLPSLFSHWTCLGSYLIRPSIHVALYTRGYGFWSLGILSIVSFHFFHLITLAYVSSCVLRPPLGHDITHCVW